jgi:hypothetical protein
MKSLQLPPQQHRPLLSLPPLFSALTESFNFLQMEDPFFPCVLVPYNDKNKSARRPNEVINDNVRRYVGFQ